MERGIGGVDEEVIHIDNEPSFSNHIAEGVVHETLEGGRGVGKPKEHYSRFEKFLMGSEGCLPLVTVLDPYVVVPPSDVEFSKDLSISQVIYEVGDEGKGVGVVDGVFVDIAVVLAGAESSILLFHKEERGGLGGVRWVDLSRGEVFIQEVLSGFSFVWREGVYFPNFRSEAVVEVDFMVIGL